MDSLDGVGLGTRLAHFGEAHHEGAVVAPIFQNSTFIFDTMEELRHAMLNVPAGPPYHYSRVGNPTVKQVEAKIANLEGTEDARLFGCGMAALSHAILTSVKGGDHVILPDTTYGPVRSFLDHHLGRFGVTSTLVTGTCTEEIADQIRPETSVIYLESPSSLLFRMQDVPAITKIAREKGITTIFDNTYNTPVHYNPAADGVDLVCHSATKYFGGHSDVTAGVICGSRERMNALQKDEIAFLGAMLHPFPAWLVQRGLRSLKIRIKQHEATANTVAAWLEDRPEIARVHHLGLPSYPQRDLVQKLLRGTGGLFSFEFKDRSPEEIDAFCNRLQLFGKGISWGGYESLVVASPTRTADRTDAPVVVRLYCGLEEPEDLIRDLDSAF